MGNQQTKKGEQLPFTAEELKVLEHSFRHTSGGHTEKITENKLLETWSTIVDKNLAQFIANFLYTVIPAAQQKQQQRQSQRVGTITFKKYAEPYYIVERGSIDEQINFIHLSLGGKNADEIDLKQLEMYITSVLLSYLHIMRDKNSPEYESWIKFGYHCNDRSAQCFAKGLIRSLEKETETESTASSYALEKWLQINPTFLIIWRQVFTYLYNHGNGKNGKLGGANHKSQQILPLQEGLPTGTNYSPILDIPHVIYINSNMPTDLRNKWRFLFSSKIMGESFSTMLGKLLKKGPTLLVVEDEDHYIFAGYAPESWSLGPNFLGDDSAMLFTLSPAMRCFNTTGYNNHYQYLNLNQQTMPNGLGMGGQYNYWGLWIDCEYGLGHSSESCTTFKDYVQLSKRKDFRIRNLEVWGVGDEPKPDESDEEGDGSHKHSILDKNLEDRVMLELSGRKMHSDGIREPELDL
ncbi:MTOR-associated protein MEAK7 isoform 1-T2 [Cochliomyia hominivorax]